MNKIIVTSPHRVCRDKKSRDCDIVAGLAADIITRKLNAIGLRGNEYRRDHDLNREPSRNTKFRKSLQKTLQLRPCILLDVHSFPNYYFDEAGDINFFNKDETPPDIVIMTGDKDTINDISISYELFMCLKQEYNVKIISDINVLDILNQSSEYNVPGILLEFNEKYASSVSELNKLCSIICDCVIKLST